MSVELGRWQEEEEENEEEEGGGWFERKAYRCSVEIDRKPDQEIFERQLLDETVERWSLFLVLKSLIIGFWVNKPTPDTLCLRQCKVSVTWGECVMK